MSIKGVYARLFLTLVLASSCLADWKSDANARIDQYRKRSTLISVVDHNGRPVIGLGVQIEQTKHLFAFGTCISNSYMYDNNYKNFILNHFEWAVCENETKWPSNESRRDVESYSSADSIYTWCNSNGIKMRGHCLVWEQPSQVQTWVQDLPYAAYPTASELLTEVDERITNGVNHFKNKFKNWDVDNEMLSDNFYSRLGGNPARAHMFQLAHDTDPNCKFFMNEYSGNSWGYFSGSGDYVTRANALIGLGAQIDGFGIQSHLGTISSFNAASYYSLVLNPLAALNRPIWVTEFDVNQPNDSIRANIMEDFYRICFSHPSVEGIVMWGFRQGRTWQKDWWLVNSGYALNAAGQRYESLMNEWTTNDTNYTDFNGVAGFRGFHGTYDITLSSPDKPDELYTIELVPGSTPAEFTIVTNLPPPAPDVNTPLPNPLTWATPPAEVNSTSITMTATTATDETNPVYYYFECINHNEANSAWQTNPVYLAKGLIPSTTYTFRVKARDSAMAQNTTGWSSQQSATTSPPDTTPPNPNPASWAMVPTASGASTIIMSATPAADNEYMPVLYYFECLTDSNKSSDWQLNPTYLAIGLTPSTQYTFRLRVKDSAQIPNITEWSSQLSATTQQAGENVELISLMTEGTANPKISGVDRALIFIAHAKYPYSLNLMSVMYGGQTMTKIVDKNYSTGDGYAYVAAFILKEPGIAAASNGTFTPTWNSTPDSVGYSSVFLSHVDQTTAIGMTDSNGTAAGTEVTGALATDYGDMVFDAVTCGQTGSYTLNNGFIEGIDRQIDSLITGAAGYKSAVGVNETPSAAFNGTVNGQSIIGFVVKAGTTDVPPSPPTNLTTTADFYNIVIDWNDNPEPDIAGYNIFMSTTPGTGYSRLNSMLLTSSNYTKDDVSVGTRYYFVVTAVDAAGLESPFSAEVSAKPGYQTCQEVINAGYQDYSDYNGDCRTDYKDLLHLVSYWLSSNCVDPDYCEFADLDLSGTVDFTDFMYFSYEWMRCYEPLDDNCTPTW